MGLDANGLYLAVKYYEITTRTNVGQGVVAIKKPEIYQGTNLSTFIVMTNNEMPRAAIIQPAVNFDYVSSNGYAWFVAKGPTNFTGDYLGAPILYNFLQWSGTNVLWTNTSWIAVSASTNYQDYFDLDYATFSAPQSNGTVDLSGEGSRLANVVIRNGFLWTSQTVGLSNTNGTYTGDSSGSNVILSATQWLKFRIPSDTTALALVDHSRFFDNSQTDNPWWYYMPSLMVNCHGDMVAGFSGSTATNSIAALFTWRLSTGTTLEQPRVIRPGQGTSTNPRWGDYSATCLDPTDDLTFWTVQEYANSPTWGTVIAVIRPMP